jgi:arylsulfatase A-like enzyme
MKRRDFLSTAGAASLGPLLPWTSLELGLGDRPTNVVMILIDDLGWTDLGCYGSDVHNTPRLDRLAQQGVRFTDAYAAAPNCSPTRSSLLTGQSPATTGITDYIPGRNVPDAQFTPPEGQHRLPDGVPILAERLKEVGYASASIGKWHLGEGTAMPSNRGFDVTVAPGQEHQQSMFPPYGVPGPDAEDDEYLTDRLSRAGATFIRRHADQPFFLYLSHYAVHRPHAGKEQLVEKYRQRLPDGAENRAVYAAMVESVDQSVGRIVDTLYEEGLFSNTLLLFTSDNGPTDVSPPRPLRSRKGTIYEGGIRVPFIVAGAEVTPRTVEVPVITHDLCATALDVAGTGQVNAVEGESLHQLLKDQTSLSRDPLHWHFPHYSWRGQRPAGAIRRGRYKLITYYGCDEVELYDLEADIGETTDLSSRQPGRARRLRRLHRKWRQRVGAVMPTPNPNFDPNKTAVPACAQEE